MKDGDAGRSRGAAPRLSPLWLWPALAAALSLLTLGFLLWNAYQHDQEEHEQDFLSDLDSVLRSIDFRIQGNAEYLRILAAEVGKGAVAEAEFAGEVRHHLRETQELVRIDWTDTKLGVRATAMDPERPMLCEECIDKAEMDRAVREAMRTRRPVATRMCKSEGAGRCFALYAPVLSEDGVKGLIRGVTSCQSLLRHAVPNHVAESNRVSLLSDKGTVACSRGMGAEIDASLVRDEPIASLANGTQVRLERHSTGLFAAQMWLLTLLCVALTLGMAYGLFSLARHAEARRRAQEILRKERDNLVNVLEAMEDGVAVVSAQLDVQYVNPVLVRDFGEYQGRKCYEYFHGHDAPCSWCMMDDVVAGKTVHTEWCYPRNDKTYDLIDTRVSNPDGTVSKLKIFRDFTERAEAEAALRRSEQQFHELFERAADAMFLYDREGRIVEANQTACDSLGYSREAFRGRTLADIHADGTDDALDDLMRSPSVAPRTALHTRHRRSDGSTFPVEVRLSRLDYHRERLMLASARDVTERERAERATQQRLQAERAAAEQTRARLAESESLQKVTTALLQKTTLSDVLDVVCGEAQRLTSASGSGVLLRDNGHLRLTTWTGSPPPRTEMIATKGSFAGLAVQRREPLFIADLTRHDLECYREPRPGALIVVPLRAWGNIIGVLDVAGEAHAFNPCDTRILTHFADQAAIAIEKARLRERAEKAAVLEERQRLARELHDSVTQSLCGASLYADAASIVSATGQSEVTTKHLRVVKSLMREALLQMRLLIYELRPPALEQGGLVGAIEARLAAVEQRAGLETGVSAVGAHAPLPPRVEEALYGFTLEALNNALKHAKAQRVEVRLTFGDASVSVEVLDDGVGFDEDLAWQSGGMGLRGMRERLERLGGNLVIDSAPDKGTRLTAEVAT